MNVLALIRQAAARLRVVTLAGGRTPSVGGAEDGRPWQKQIAVLQHYGFRSTLPAQAQVVTVALGGSPLQEIAIASELPSTGPQPATGDVVLYCQDGSTVTVQANGATIRIAADGAVTIDAATGKDVTVNGGAAKVVRVGDAVAAGTTMATWIAAVNTALAAAGHPVTAPTDFGTSGGGAAHFKA